MVLYPDFGASGWTFIGVVLAMWTGVIMVLSVISNLFGIYRLKRCKYVQHRSYIDNLFSDIKIIGKRFYARIVTKPWQIKGSFPVNIFFPVYGCSGIVRT